MRLSPKEISGLSHFSQFNNSDSVGMSISSMSAERPHPISLQGIKKYSYKILSVLIVTILNIYVL